MQADQAKATDGAVRRVATNRQEVGDFWVPFTTKEVLRLAPGLSLSTLKFWEKRRRWIAPRRRGRQGVGGDAMWSAWQTIALVIMASVQRCKRGARTYLGEVGVRTAWNQLSGLSDELLLSEAQGQDARLAEEVAAALARMAHDTPELPPDLLDGVGRVVLALDRKVGAMRHRLR